MNSNKKFKRILERNNLLFCECGKEIGREDVMWNNGCTEVGTPFAIIEVICTKCQKEITRVSTWWPSIDNFEELVDVLEEYENKI